MLDVDVDCRPEAVVPRWAVEASEAGFGSMLVMNRRFPNEVGGCSGRAAVGAAEEASDNLVTGAGFSH